MTIPKYEQILNWDIEEREMVRSLLIHTGQKKNLRWLMEIWNILQFSLKPMN